MFKDLLFLNSFKAAQTITTIQQDIFGCFRRRNLQQENLLKEAAFPLREFLIF